MHNQRSGLSADAQCLLYWANLSRTIVADDDDASYCEGCARLWAQYVIAGDSPAGVLEAHGDSGVA